MARRGNSVQSVERAFRILDLLRDAETEMSLGEIARTLRLSPSTVHRLLATLMECKVVHQDPQSRRYSLALRMVLYGKAVLDRYDFRERAHPLLGELSKEVGETVFMGILDNFELVYIDHVDTLDHELRMTPQIGRRQGAYCTALGKVLLAHLEPSRLDMFLSTNKLVKLTENTITSPQALREELEKVRRQGYAVDRQESEIGICCVAAPVRGIGGRVVAAISVSGPATRLMKKGLETNLRGSVQAMAARISQVIGV